MTPRAQPLLLAAVAAHAAATGAHAGLRAEAAICPWRWVLRRALQAPAMGVPPVGGPLIGPAASPEPAAGAAPEGGLSSAQPDSVPLVRRPPSSAVSHSPWLEALQRGVRYMLARLGNTVRLQVMSSWCV